MKKTHFSFRYTFLFLLSGFTVVSICFNELDGATPTYFRAEGYSLAGELKTRLTNNGKLTGSNFLNTPAPEGYYHNYQYISTACFILGVPGRDSLGNPYPWAMRPAVDSLTGQVYPDSIIYWGPTVSESWFDRTAGASLTDWEADSLSHGNVFGNGIGNDITGGVGEWIIPGDFNPVLAHSNYPVTWPGGGLNGFWPGFWGWDENGQVVPGQFFSDEDIYWEMDDRTATRDVDPTQGYPTGIKVKAQVYSFAEIPGGFIIFRFRLINQSPWNYENIYSGFYFDADIYHRLKNGSMTGRTNTDDMMQFSWGNDLAYIWDLDDNSSGETGLAYVGIGYIQSPAASRNIDWNADGSFDVFAGQPTGVTGWHWFDWYFRPGAWDGGPNGPFSGDGQWRVAKDKEVIQYKLLAGDTASIDMDSLRIQYNHQHYFHPALNGSLNPFFDSNSALLSSYPQGLDCVFIMSNGPFNLGSGDSAEVVTTFLAAPDSNSIIQYARTARHLYQRGFPRKEIHLAGGNGGEVFSGNATLSWQVDPAYPYSADTVDVYLGKGREPEWKLLAANLPNTGTFSFNTDTFIDGVFYRAAVVSHTGPGFVYGISDTFFTINNPNQNVPPELIVLRPQTGDTLSNMFTLNWIALDADFDSLFFSLDVSNFGIWTNIYQNQANTNTCQLSTYQFLNGPASVKISVDDHFGPGHTTTQTIDNLLIQNELLGISDTVFQHIAGSGNGKLQLNVTEQQLLNGHRYRLEFDSLSSNTSLTAKLFDLNTGSYLAQNVEYNNTLGSILFDGLKLTLLGFNPVKIDSVFWKNGNSDWIIQPVRYGNGNPANYQLVFDTLGVDTLYHAISGAPLIPLPFRAMNLSFHPTVPLKIVGIDFAPMGVFGPNDIIFLTDSILAGHPVSPPVRTFRLYFSWDSTGIAPQPGDIFYFSTIGYFTELDTILFKSPTWLDIDDRNSATVREFALYPNYPNPFNPATTIRFALPRAGKVKLEIFNILGQRVKTLVDERKTAGEYQIVWNAQNAFDTPVSSGVYFARLKAGSFIKIQKLLLVR